MDIAQLQKRAFTAARIGYDERKRRRAELRAAVQSIVAALSFRWRAVAMDNPTQNHTGSTNGRVHIVLDEPIHIGRITRAPRQALCGGDTVNLWNDAERDDVTCKRCLEIAQRIRA